MGFFDPFSGAADVGKLKSDLSSLKSDVETHTNNNDIHVTASDKNNWNSKLDKNQGSENSGKVLGTNANGEVIPLNGYGFEYDEETKMLKYGTDPTSNLNQCIGLDDTLSKRGYAADAGAVGELKEDLGEYGDRLTTLDGVVNLHFELGNADANDLTLIYADSTSRIRTPKGTTMHLSVGAVVKIENYTDYSYLLLRRNDDNWVRAIQWRKQDFIISAEDDYVMIVKKESGDISDVKYVADMVSITSPNADVSTLKTDVSTLERGYIVPVWDCGTFAGGKDKWDSANIRTRNIMHIKKGSKLSKKVTTTDFAITACFYERNDIDSYQYSTQIITRGTSKYIFEEDCYVKLLLQYVGSDKTTPQYAYDMLCTELIPCHDYSTEGVDISVLGDRIWKGSGVLFKFANGKTLLMDCFDPITYSGTKLDLVTTLRLMGVKKLDFFMLSHWHIDHCGNIPHLIEYEFIDQNTTVYLPTDLDKTQTTGLPSGWSTVVGYMDEILPKIKETNCTIVYPTENQTVEIADCIIKFWNTDHSVFYNSGAYHSTNYNDWSLCATVFCGNVNFCYTADLGPIGQKKMMDLNTLVKANLYTSTHHGWDNGVESNYWGLLPVWINRLNPDVVFSQDYQQHENMMYAESTKNGFPMQKWCEKNGIGHYRTYANGTINVHMDKHGWKFTSPCSRYIINSCNWLA